MNGVARRCVLCVFAALLAGPALSAQGDARRGPSRFYAFNGASSLVQQGLLLPPPAAAEAAQFPSLPAPGIGRVPSAQANSPLWAQATSAPWIDSNAWRFRRGLAKANYRDLPAGAAGLAAAEAFTFAADAILGLNPADEQDLGNVLRFLKAHERPPLPVMANIGIVDDGSPAMGEVLNMLTRRNLLYRVVSGPDRTLDLNVQLGTPDFPKESASNPSDFAARVREKLGDDKRLIRVYGTSTVVAHFTGDGQDARLYLLSYSRNRSQTDVRIRVLGRYEPASFAALAAPPDAKLIDVQHPGRTTEFSLPTFSTIAIVDLRRIR